MSRHISSTTGIVRKRAEDAADAERVGDCLAQAVLLRNLEVDHRARLVAADLNHIDRVVRAVERGAAIGRRGDARRRPDRRGDAMRDDLRDAQPLGINIHQRDLAPGQFGVREDIAEQILREDDAPRADHRDLRHCAPPEQFGVRSSESKGFGVFTPNIEHRTPNSEPPYPYRTCGAATCGMAFMISSSVVLRLTISRRARCSIPAPTRRARDNGRARRRHRGGYAGRSAAPSAPRWPSSPPIIATKRLYIRLPISMQHERLDDRLRLMDGRWVNGVGDAARHLHRGADRGAVARLVRPRLPERLVLIDDAGAAAQLPTGRCSWSPPVVSSQ